MEFRSPLGRVRGLGASREGLHQWWVIRVSGLALVPLTIWFVFSAINLAGADLATFTAWLKTHGNAALMILFIITMFHHSQLGMVEIIEDYIPSEKPKLAAIIINKFLFALFGMASIVAVLKLTLGG